MKKMIFSATFALITSLCSAQTEKQEAPKMIELYHVVLTNGPVRNQDSATAAKIQAGHMANMEKLHKEGKLLLAGPFNNKGGDWRGLFIMKCKDKAEAEALVKTDPAVVAGRLTYIITPWFTETNCILK